MPINRRYFLQGAAWATGGLRAYGANEKFRVACMGCRGRARQLLYGFAQLPEVEVAAVIDVDSRLFPEAVKGVAERQGKEPTVLGDFRRALDDKSIDILVVGTPTHWHAIPAIMACQAGKHVYVEKPAGHNFRESQVMLAAARRYNRVMQVGMQSRSGENFREACDYIRTGVLGKVHAAAGWESAHQRDIGRPADEPVPAGVDYDMWLGPAPKRPFNRNRFHGSWRWFFDYCTGDLGNDGVHRIDYARRGLEAAMAAQGMTLPEWPHAISASGGKYHFDDAQEWPDTLSVNYEYPGALLQYEMRIWSKPPLHGEPEGAAVYGEDGYAIIGNESWRAFDEKGKLVKSGSGAKTDDDVAHKRDMLKCIRDGGRPACDIAIGHVASGLVHMGNTSWRTGRKLHWDAARNQYKDDQEANAHLGRVYRSPWTLPEL